MRVDGRWIGALVGAALGALMRRIPLPGRQSERLREENARLRAENERLRAQLTEVERG